MTTNNQERADQSARQARDKARRTIDVRNTLHRLDPYELYCPFSRSRYVHEVTHEPARAASRMHLDALLPEETRLDILEHCCEIARYERQHVASVARFVREDDDECTLSLLWKMSAVGAREYGRATDSLAGPPADRAPERMEPAIDLSGAGLEAAWQALIDKLEPRAARLTEEYADGTTTAGKTAEELGRQEGISKARVNKILDRVRKQTLPNLGLSKAERNLQYAVNTLQYWTERAGLEGGQRAHRRAGPAGSRLRTNLLNMSVIEETNANWIPRITWLCDPIQNTGAADADAAVQEAMRLISAEPEQLRPDELQDRSPIWRKAMADHPALDLVTAIRARTGMSPRPKTWVY